MSQDKTTTPTTTGMAETTSFIQTPNFSAAYPLNTKFNQQKQKLFDYYNMNLVLVADQFAPSNGALINHQGDESLFALNDVSFEEASKIQVICI